mmetsp:Transcript_11402/g.11430  ORF Transcript_11402/g.11430 Transcript_11402/m.11430 type:complete len:597 (+) Transcript_11402:163-1953(+)|eukprot:CAMPEP_0182418712 /NCGR_PEP_ID=MMETSP1167-20130531/3084_1 /TAXON_ID=2988 /ORGANISM="Mallomonas Sp, Strain CCMP3275" /LENGTH=596 /DNA_ID=CAMNT_0024593045 /DNA_START=51 /DNA_END=1841 /DNA_ORIENTATION=-
MKFFPERRLSVAILILLEYSSVLSSDPTSEPSVAASFGSTGSAEPTVVPSSTRKPTSRPSYHHDFASLLNGGFETDADKVISGSGWYSTMLPTGWTDHSSTILIPYSTDEDYYQDDSGYIFLSIFGGNSGYIEQSVFACPGVTLTLSLDAASFHECTDCSSASFEVLVDGVVVMEQSDLSSSWTQFHTTFQPDAYEFTLRFQSDNGEYVQLFLDNISLNENSGTCVPTIAPTASWEPSSAPSVEPTAEPSAVPSTAYPTSTDVMKIAEGRITLKYVSFDNHLSNVDMYILRSVLVDIMHTGSSHIYGVSKIGKMEYKRLSSAEMAVLFNVNIMAGRHNVSSFNFDLIFNETRQYLYIATVKTDILLTKLAIMIESFNDTSLSVYSTSAVTVDYFRLGDGDHKFHNHHILLSLLIAILSGVVGFLSIFVMYTLMMRSLTKPEVNDDEKKLLEMSGADLSTSGSSITQVTALAAAKAAATSDIRWENNGSSLARTYPTKQWQATMQPSYDPAAIRTFNPPLPPTPQPNIYNAPDVSSHASDGAYDTSTHTYDYEEENDGKFYSMFAAKKAAISDSFSKPAFESIEPMSSHSSIPEQCP